MSHFQPHSVVSCSPSLLQQPPQSVLTPLSNSGNLVLGIGTWTVGWKKMKELESYQKTEYSLKNKSLLTKHHKTSNHWVLVYLSWMSRQPYGVWLRVAWPGSNLTCSSLPHFSLSFSHQSSLHLSNKAKKKCIYIYIQKPHKIPDVMDVWAIWLQKQKSQCIWTTEWVQEIEWVIKTDVSLAPLGELARNCSVHQVYWQTELNPPCSRSLPSMVEDKHLV